MPHHPSPRLQAFLAALLPPASRDQYLGVFLAVLPKIVVSAVRRKLRPGSGVGLMAGLAATALAIAAILTRGRRSRRLASGCAGPHRGRCGRSGARHFQRLIWWRNARESVVGFALLGFNANVLATMSFESPVQWLQPALGCAGLACLLDALHAKAGSRRVPRGDARTVLRFHQDEIARQRDRLRLVPFWYLLPLAPGMIARTILVWHPVRAPLALVFMAAIFYGVFRLNAAGARWLDRQLEQARARDDVPDAPAN